jgi:hypothetical protein
MCPAQDAHRTRTGQRTGRSKSPNKFRSWGRRQTGGNPVGRLGRPPPPLSARTCAGRRSGEAGKLASEEHVKQHVFEKSAGAGASLWGWWWACGGQEDRCNLPDPAWTRMPPHSTTHRTIAQDPRTGRAHRTRTGPAHRTRTGPVDQARAQTNHPVHNLCF